MASLKNKVFQRKSRPSTKSTNLGASPVVGSVPTGSASFSGAVSHTPSAGAFGVQPTSSSSGSGGTSGGAATGGTAPSDRKRAASWRPIILGMKGQAHTEDVLRIEGLRNIYNNDMRTDDTDVGERIWQQSLARFLRTLALNDLFNCLKLLQSPETPQPLVAPAPEKGSKNKSDSSSSSSSKAVMTAASVPGKATKDPKTEQEVFEKKTKAFLKIIRVYKTNIAEHALIVRRDVSPPSQGGTSSSSTTPGATPFATHVSWAFCFNLHLKQHFAAQADVHSHYKNPSSVEPEKLFTYDSLLTHLKSWSYSSSSLHEQPPTPESPPNDDSLFSPLSSSSSSSSNSTGLSSSSFMPTSSMEAPDQFSRTNEEMKVNRVKAERSQSMSVPKPNTQSSMSPSSSTKKQSGSSIARGSVNPARNSAWRTTLPLGMDSSSKFGIKMLLGSESRKSIIHTLQTFISLNQNRAQDYVNIALELIDFFERYRNDPFSCLLGLPPSERVLERVLRLKKNNGNSCKAQKGSLVIFKEADSNHYLYGRCANQSKGVLDVFTDTLEQKRFVMPAQFCFEITEGLLQEIAIHSNSDVHGLVDLIENPIKDLLNSVQISVIKQIEEHLISLNSDAAVVQRCFHTDNVSLADYPAEKEILNELRKLLTQPGLPPPNVIEILTEAQSKAHDFFDDDSIAKFVPSTSKDKQTVHTAILTCYHASLSSLVERLEKRSEEYGKSKANILNGSSKKLLTNWWHTYIKEVCSKFLTQQEVDMRAVPQQYLNEPPKDLKQVKKNLRILQQILDPNEKQKRPDDLLNEVKGTIYPKINAFLQESKIVIDEYLGIPHNPDLSNILDLIKVVQANDDEDAKNKTNVMDLIKDMDYLLEMQRLEDPEYAKNHNTLHVVPVSGLCISMFCRMENEHKTVLELWSPRPDGKSVEENLQSVLILHQCLLMQDFMSADNLLAVALQDYSYNFDLQDRNGWTVLHCAASAGHFTFVDKLIEAGASVSLQNVDGNTPLHYLVRQKSDPDAVFRLVAKMLKQGASIDVPNNMGETPVHVACMYNRSKVIQFLLDHILDINCLTKSKENMLHYAVRSGDTSNVELLLGAGVDITARSANGDTPYDLAVKFKIVGATEVLAAFMKQRHLLDNPPSHPSPPIPSSPSQSPSQSPSLSPSPSPNEHRESPLRSPQISLRSSAGLSSLVPNHPEDEIKKDDSGENAVILSVPPNLENNDLQKQVTEEKAPVSSDDEEKVKEDDEKSPVTSEGDDEEVKIETQEPIVTETESEPSPAPIVVQQPIVPLISLKSIEEGSSSLQPNRSPRDLTFRSAPTRRDEVVVVDDGDDVPDRPTSPYFVAPLPALISPVSERRIAPLRILPPRANNKMEVIVADQDVSSPVNQTAPKTVSETDLTVPRCGVFSFGFGDASSNQHIDDILASDAAQIIADLMAEEAADPEADPTFDA